MGKLAKQNVGEKPGFGTGISLGRFSRMSNDVVRNMRARAAQCRRLAVHILDEHATQALLRIAAEIEVDVIQLEAERRARPSMPGPAQE